MDLEKILQDHKDWLEDTSKGKQANLRGADLCEANLCGADLSEADLCGANLCGADLSEADLCGAKLRGANLCGANLCGADLSEADLKNVRVNSKTCGLLLACPEEGSFIAYKQASGKIVVLEIPADAKRSSATSLKCRCSKAKVLRIENFDGSPAEENFVASFHDPKFIYKVGEVVQVDDFDENRWEECSNGIHFFLNREVAVQYMS